MSDSSSKIHFHNLKEIKETLFQYKEHATFIEKGKLNNYILALTKYRLYKVKEKKFSRKSVVLSLPFISLNNLIFGIHEEMFVVYLQFFSKNVISEMDIAFKDKSSAERVIRVIARAVCCLRQVIRNFNLIVDLGDLAEVDFQGKPLSNNRRLAVCYEMLCDSYRISPSEPIIQKLSQNKTSLLDINKLFTNESGEELPIDLDTFRVLGETLRNVPECFTQIECKNALIFDIAYAEFFKNIVLGRHVAHLNMSDCKITSPSCMSGVEEGFSVYNGALKTLVLSENPQMGNQGIEMLAGGLGNSSLEVLNLSNCGFGARGMEKLSLCLCSKYLINSIKVLDVSKNFLKREGAQFLANFLESCKKLRTLNVSRTDFPINAVLKPLLKNEKADLSFLDFSFCSKLEAKDAEALRKLLQQTKKLSFLSLAGSRLTIPLLKVVLEGLQANPDANRGQVLKLSFDLSENNFEGLSPGLLEQPVRCVREIYLSKVACKFKDFEVLLKELEKMPRLHTLKLERCSKMSGASAKEDSIGSKLAEFCHSAARLEYLSLSDFAENCFEPKSFGDFIEGIKTNNSLRRLDLENCRLGDEEVEALAGALEENETLRIVNADNNRATAKGHLKLINAMKVSKTLVGNLPRHDLKAIFQGKSSDILLKLKLAADEAEHRFRSNRVRVAEVEIHYENNFEFDRKPAMHLSEEQLEFPRGKQFGVDLVDIVGTTKLRHFHARIPTLLIKMARYLFKDDGHLNVGVFRLAPDSKESEDVLRQLDTGTFSSCDDINCISNCIKTWFRLLPQRLLGNHLVEKVCADSESARAPRRAIAENVAEPQQSLLLWLLALLSEVSQFEEVNRMGPKNLAIVFGPNLVDGHVASSIDQSERACEFLERAIIDTRADPLGLEYIGIV